MLARNTLQLGDEYAVLVGAILPKQTKDNVHSSLLELEMLAQTAGVICVKRFTQRLQKPNSATFIGGGKLESIREFIKQIPEISIIIFDDDLTGSQFVAIQSVLKIRVIDRSMLILDIFAIHAKTARSKTQVEMAQYQYLMPRLRGMWKHLERQGGGIGTRGPGETELETDRRIVQQKISTLTKKLAKIEQQGNTQRKHRKDIAQVTLSGYTNAGKTAIMNFLSKEQLVSQDKLFVTLDTTTRKIGMQDKGAFLISDTVGFIQKIPHHLIESFKTTLEEVCFAHLILHVIDVSHQHAKQHFLIVQKTLEDLGASYIPTMLILNKLDNVTTTTFGERSFSEEDKQMIEMEILNEWKQFTGLPCILVSAKTGQYMERLRSRLWEKVQTIMNSSYLT